MTDRSAVVVTGASSGIGRACALELDRAGYQVFASVRKTKDAALLKKAASEHLTPILMDVTDESSIRSAASIVAQAVGNSGLVGLVNNAGIGVSGPVEFIAADDLRRQFEINVFGLVRVTQAFLPLIRQARGRIINIGSVGGKITMPFGGALCASKYAVEAINDALRMELYPWGIHVILIAPAMISTPAVDRLVPDSEAVIRKFSPEGHKYYEQTFRNFVRTTVTREKAGSPPEVVAQTVLQALTAHKPKARYPVGANARILTLLPRFLTAHQLDKVRFRLFGLPQEFGAWIEADQGKIAGATPSNRVIGRSR